MTTTTKTKRAGWGEGSRVRGCRARRAGLLMLLLASATVLLAACGGSSGNTNHAGGNGGSGSPSTASSNKLAQFSQCMRAHGEPEFPDPVDGHLTLTVANGSALDPSSPQFQSALQSCKSLEPAGFAAGGSVNTQQQSQVLQFVNCMHSHGEPNIPDPNASGGVLMSGKSVDPNSPQFQAAMQACRSLLPAGAVGG